MRASCSTTSTVSPSCSFSSRTMRKISRTTIGASPSDGSSSSSSRGMRHQRAGEREHLLLAARERAGALVGRARAPTGTTPRRARCRPSRRAVPRVYAPRRQVLHHVELGERAAALRHVRDAGAARPPRARRAAACPAKRISPLRRTIPEIARSVVVLPAPFAPSTATIAPSGTSSETPWSACTAP